MKSGETRTVKTITIQLGQQIDRRRSLLQRRVNQFARVEHLARRHDTNIVQPLELSPIIAERSPSFEPIVSLELPHPQFRHTTHHDKGVSQG